MVLNRFHIFQCPLKPITSCVIAGIQTTLYSCHLLEQVWHKLICRFAVYRAETPPTMGSADISHCIKYTKLIADCLFWSKKKFSKLIKQPWQTTPATRIFLKNDLWVCFSDWCTFLKPERNMWLLCSDKFFTFFLIKGIITNHELLKDEVEADAVDYDVLI